MSLTPIDPQRARLPQPSTGRSSGVPPSPPGVTAAGADTIELSGHRKSGAAGGRNSRRDDLTRALLAHVPPADRAAAKTAIPAIIEAACKAGASDPNRIAYLLATAQTESDFGANMTETGHSQEWFNQHYGSQDGNRPGTSDGFRYRGRGYVQVTHAGRYAEVSHQLGLPDVRTVRSGSVKLEPALVAHPEKLSEPKLAAQALVQGVAHNLFTHNSAAALNSTIPLGKKPGDVDFYHARGLVNGIVKDQAQTIARHATTYAEVLDGYRQSVLGDRTGALHKPTLQARGATLTDSKGR